MIRTYWNLALLAAVGVSVAGCPPSYGETTETSSGSEGSTAASEGSGTTATPTTGAMTTSEPTSGNTSSTTNVGMSTGPGVTTGMPGCADDADCSADDPTKPFCVDTACVSCEATPDPNTSCAGLDPQMPVCDVDTGSCVVCNADNKELCSGMTPVCDLGTHVCVGCSDQADCPDSACNTETGACFAPDYVIYVDAAAQCDVGDGTMAAPFCLIAQALEKVGMGDPSLGWTIKIMSGNYIQPTLVVPDGSLLAIVGEGGLAKLRSTTAATLQVGANSKVHLHKLNFSSNADDTGVSCTSGQVRGDDLLFVLNRQGYTGTDCSADFRRVVFFKNSGGGLSTFGIGSTKLVNSYISNNGSNADATYGGLQSGQGHELYLSYTSVLNNLSEVGARSLQCTPDAGPAEIHNSVIIAFVPPSIDCGTAIFDHSAIDEGKMDGDTNLAATMMDVMAWFEPQVGGVYKAKVDSPIAEVAAWMDGDPKVDFNGDPRPAIAESPDYPGADRPQ